MDWTLEVVPMPVTDIDRAKDFYADKVGFNVDFDQKISDSFRIVQLTPPGSGCSIVLGASSAQPGSTKGLQLVVSDIEAARAQLLERGVDVSEVNEMDSRDGGKFVYFNDPDDNTWAVQEIRARAKS